MMANSFNNCGSLKLKWLGCILPKTSKLRWVVGKVTHQDDDQQNREAKHEQGPGEIGSHGPLLRRYDQEGRRSSNGSRHSGHFWLDLQLLPLWKEQQGSGILRQLLQGKATASWTCNSGSCCSVRCCWLPLIILTCKGAVHIVSLDTYHESLWVFFTNFTLLKGPCQARLYAWRRTTLDQTSAILRRQQT